MWNISPGRKTKESPERHRVRVLACQPSDALRRDLVVRVRRPIRRLSEPSRVKTRCVGELFTNESASPVDHALVQRAWRHLLKPCVKRDQLPLIDEALLKIRLQPRTIQRMAKEASVHLIEKPAGRHAVGLRNEGVEKSGSVRLESRITRQLHDKQAKARQRELRGILGRLPGPGELGVKHDLEPADELAQ